MTTQIKVLRENVIKVLSGIKDDNVSIAGIAIERRKLLEALKLQTQSDADMLTLTYGNISWHYDYEHHSPTYKWEYDDNDKMSRQVTKSDWWEYKPYTTEPQLCIQISCNHTTMRFMNHPKDKHGYVSEPIPLNFIDHREYVKPELFGIPLDTQELIRALNFVLPCVETDGLREVLACVLFESGDDIIKLVTADGFRLSIAKIQAKGIPQDKVLIHFKDIIRLLTYLKAIKPIGKGKGKYYPEVYLFHDYKTIKFSSDNGSIEFNKQTGDFPNYGLLIPKDGTKIECIASDMLEAVKAVSVTARDGSGIIRLQFYTGNPVGKIVLTAKSEEVGESSVDCDAIVESDCKIAVNAKYLTDLLSQCGDARITLRVKHYTDPLTFDISDTRQVVVMPMFVQWGEPT